MNLSDQAHSVISGSPLRAPVLNLRRQCLFRFAWCAMIGVIGTDQTFQVSTGMGRGQYGIQLLLAACMVPAALLLLTVVSLLKSRPRTALSISTLLGLLGPPLLFAGFLFLTPIG